MSDTTKYEAAKRFEEACLVARREALAEFIQLLRKNGVLEYDGPFTWMCVFNDPLPSFTPRTEEVSLKIMPEIKP